jgi:hypothetical protein
MKKLLFFILIPFLGFSQVTITNLSTYPQANQTYVLDNAYPTLFQATNFVEKDAGTNSYRYSDIISNEKFWIVRKNGLWHIERFDYTGLAIYLLYRTSLISSSNEPVCNANWQVWTGVQFSYGDSRMNTGQLETPIIQSINCGCATILSASLQPKFLQLPLLSNSDVGSISLLQPAQGKLTYSSCNNEPIIYNGSSWDKFILNRNGEININGSIKLPIVVNNSNVVSTVQLGINDNTYIHKTPSNINLNLPTAVSSTGKHYFIVNHGTGTITLNTPVRISATTGTTTILSDAHFHIVFDGTQWHKIN